MLSILVLLIAFSFPSSAFSIWTKLQLPDGAFGPETIAFDISSQGPYTGVADGRVIKYNGDSFEDFAYSHSPRLNSMCHGNNGNTNQNMGLICGRPLGVVFHKATGDLYIADAYHGLLVAKDEPYACQAKVVADCIDGVPFLFTDAVDIDQDAGIVYFTDASTTYDQSESKEAIATSDSTGRLLKYDINTKDLSVLVSELTLPVGAAVSSDGTYVLISEFTANRIRKYWVQGSKAKTSEILLNLPGSPDNIQRTASGDFWVAVNVDRSSTEDTNVPMGYKISGSGEILSTLNLSTEYERTEISEVHDYEDKYYVGVSDAIDFIGVYNLLRTTASSRSSFE